jgi:hypothetical protein
VSGIIRKEYPFHSACVELCRLLEVRPPKKSSVRDWLRAVKNDPALDAILVAKSPVSP